MSIANNVILSPQTAVGTSGIFSINQGECPATVIAGGLAGAETASVQVQCADGVFRNAGHVPQLNATSISQTIFSPGVYQVVKTATAAAVGINLFSA